MIPGLTVTQRRELLEAEVERLKALEDAGVEYEHPEAELDRPRRGTRHDKVIRGAMAHLTPEKLYDLVWFVIEVAAAGIEAGCPGERPVPGFIRWQATQLRIARMRTTH